MIVCRGGESPLTTRTDFGGNLYPFTQPGNAFAVVNYCLVYEFHTPS